MNRSPALAFCALLAALLVTPSASATSYEAALPVELHTDPDLCAWVPCKDVLPGAATFSPRMGRPSYVEGYAPHNDDDDDDDDDDEQYRDQDDREHHEDDNARGELVGYVFLSTDIVDIPAYSGKPVVTLIGMDTHGSITGIRILKHSEPILLLGIPEGELTRFTEQYIGRFVGDRIEIGHAREGVIGLDAISGATVTVISENQVILRSGYEIAKQAGIIKARDRPQARFSAAEGTMDWTTLVAEGSVQRLMVTPEQVGMPADAEPYMDLHFGYLNAPVVGRSILGADGYQRLMADLKQNEHAIFIIGNGTGSFKGSGFVRGGIYDRIQVAQEMDTFTFRDTDYRNLYDVYAPGAPEHRESGVFIVRSAAFSAAYPWSLIFLANREDAETGAKSFVNFDREYWLPGKYLDGGRPDYSKPDPAWLKVWKDKSWELGGFALMLTLTAFLLVNRDKLVRASSRRDKTAIEGPKFLVWTLSVVVVGGYAMAQPSITQVLTWFHSIIYEWRWELFLSDPYIFIFWWFIIVTVFLWGRGLFCGWLCPYGAMTEILHNVVSKTGLRRFQFYLPMRWHNRAKWIKYFIFAGLLGMSFYSMPMAEKFAEVEPFKTTFLVGVWNRSWPFVTYWVVLFVASIFMERPFCKYLCPLGAALAVPSTFRFFGLKRKSECQTCTACARGCTQLAIDERGRIDQRECLLCLDCMVLYYDSHSCPPLAKERKTREKAGLPLTPITPRGYFEPLAAGAGAGTATVAETIRPPLPVARWFRDEFLFHLLPWSGDFRRQIFAIQAVAAFLVVIVTTAWMLMATGRIGPVIMIAWWAGWSVYEVLTRMRFKPVIKQGPWWGSDYRPAKLADMISYVATKNLLIGAGLFLVLHAAGVLHILQNLPALKWLHT